MFCSNRKYRVPLYRFVLISLLSALLVNLLLPGHALAWKPTTHVFLGDIALKDALDNGKVTIYRVNYRTGQIVGVVGEYAVDPTILAALQSNAAQYHAGILGPDAYPDILTGQQVIHPGMEHTGVAGGTDAWLKYLWRQSLLPGNSTPAIKAFTVGYLTHAAGDMFGHTFINNFTGGEFAITPPAGPANAIKHVILEGYIDKRLDKSALDASFFNASISGVDRFIYDSLVDARSGTELGANLLRKGGEGTKYSIPRTFSTIRDSVAQEAVRLRLIEKNCGLFENCNFPGLRARYLEAWRDDIDEGLRAWPQVSHQVAIALFFNPARKADIDTALNVMTQYGTDHLASMTGLPDFVGKGLSFIKKIAGFLDALIEKVAPDFILAPMKELKAELLNKLLLAAIGMSKDDLKKYLTSPELYFDAIMNSGAGVNVTLQTMNAQYLHLTDTGYNNPNEAFDYSKVPATYNTATMSKLILLSQAEINRLLSDLGSSKRLAQSNIMLGFVPSLDGSLQWLQGMIFAQDSNAYKQIFMLQPGETPLNGWPVAQPDSGYTTANDTPLVVPAPGVLANDSDPDSDPLTATLTVKTVYQPQHGLATMGLNGSFIYTPTAVALNDAFGYYVSDGFDTSDIVWVTIAVTPGNDPPTASDDGSFQAYEDQPFTLLAPGVLLNDHDPDSDPINALVVSQPNNGTLTLELMGSFVYTPNLDFYGDDSFTYKANDGSEDSAAVTVTLNVLRDFNQVTAGDESYVILKNTPLSVPAPGLLANDSNRDGLPLTAVLVNDSNRGTVTLNPDGSFIFTPTEDYVGDTGFVYEATDGVVSSNGSATQIIIRESNATPVAENDTFVINDKAIIIVPAPGLLSNDWDSDYHEEYEGFGLPPTDPMTATLVSAPSNGNLILDKDGAFTYTPGVGFTGRDSFTYRSSDGWGASNLATVRIADSTLNQAPLAGDDNYQTAKATPLEQPAPGILANDSDGDGDPLEILPERDPANGTIKLNPDGSFVYSSTLTFEGVDSFTYSIADSVGVSRTATVTVTVGNNQQPTASNDQVTTTQGVAITINVKLNDSDPDGDALTITILSQPISGTATVDNGKIVYTPTASFVGNDSFTYRVSDGRGGTATATVSLTVSQPVAQNQQPTAANDQTTTPQGVAVTIDVKGNDSDPDGDALTVTVLTQPANGSAVVNSGKIVYTSTANFTGSDSFTYGISDGKGGTATATVSVTVTGSGNPAQKVFLPLVNR